MIHSRKKDYTKIHFENIRLTMQPPSQCTGIAPDSATELSASDKAAGLDVRSVLHNKKRHQRDTPALPRLGSATQIKTIILPFSCINSKLTPQYQLLALTR